MIARRPSLSDNELLAILSLSHNATAIYTTEDLVIEAANDAMLAFWHADKTVIGHKLEEAVPILSGNPLLDLLKNVWRTGQTYQAQEVPVVYREKKQTVYFDFEYRAIKNHEGRIHCILHTANDVTERTLKNLAKVEFSQHRLGQMVMSSPVGMTILRSRYLIVEIANDPMLEIWSRKREEVLGRSLIEIFPDQIDRRFPSMIYSVFDSGAPVTMSEVFIEIADKNGNKSSGYLSISYNPLFDPEGNVESVLITVNDVSKAVAARKEVEQNRAALQKLIEELAATNLEFEAINHELESTNNEFVLINEELSSTNDELAFANEEVIKSRDTLNLAIEAADIITWRADLGTGEFTMSDNGAELVNAIGNKLSFESFLETVGAGHRERINQVINKAIANKKKLNIEFQLKSASGQKKLWYKLNALPHYSIDGTPTYLTGTLLDITEQKEDDQRKNDFIAMVSHELKTPITSLKAYIQLLAVNAQKAGDAFTVNALAKSNAQINKMTTLINGFLNLSRLESGKISLDIKRFDLALLVAEIVDEAKTTQNTHTIIYEPCEGVLVNADADKIGSVINNLINNALKYSPRGTEVTVVCSSNTAEARVSIKDQGIGLSPKDIDRVFDRFFRVEAPQMQTISGFGIGLYLSAEIVRRHNGHIWAKSEIGKGSTFYFTLPLA
ncbi:PAS domain-containing sensor histidine kinase [Mucilaginibacter ginkgonis]|uniref:histidine kinase n=1 Tax=Mucilaginibacter ginkgonis TaxID=2682091 RepID=A0A6I4HY44_9SPHI|nr:ATP-binding protein [Mucilaginibacter ginkgonis]QQL49377.1 PAS domain-containing protein [Mucilaginibacter ginkgonis]